MKNYVFLLYHHIDINAQKIPDKTALIEDERSISWSEYSSASSWYAEKMSSRFRPKSKVFFLVEKNIAGYVALAAAMKAGVTYIPISPNLPEERYKILCQALSPDGVIIARQFSALRSTFESFTDDQIFEIPAEVQEDAIRSRCTSWYPAQVTEKELAYIMFTSGTTGMPKGVMITHRAVLQYSQWAAAHCHADENDVVFGHTPLNFDVSVYAFGSSIVSGAALLTIASHHESNVPYMTSALEKNNTSVWISAPSLLTLFVKYKWMEKISLPRLRVVSYVGEELPNKTLIQWMQKFPDTGFHNLYGPTESTVTNIEHHYRGIPRPHDPVPIGLPHENNQVFLVDEENRIINEPGIKGEIVIHSPGVSVGYFGDPEKTSEKFQSWGDESSFQACYRTGDLAYFDKESTIFLVGRKDNQVKIRSHRIELGEIEFTLNQFPGVSQSAVAAVFSPKLEEKTLVAFVESPLEIKEHELRYHCSQKLPSYMIPFKICVLNNFPRNNSGKIDRPFLSKKAEKLVE